MSHEDYEDIQQMTVCYRNAVYQGVFNKNYECRHGFGLVYSTDNHMVMGTTWHHDLANQATFIYYNHSHYVYGFWKNHVPHGFNAIRMDKIVFFTYCQMGIIKDRMLIVNQQTNIAIILEKNQDNQFEEIEEGDLLSDLDLNNFIHKCNWLEFKQQWKTLIAFISAYLNYQQENKPKLKRINMSQYRYGYDEGIATFFDNEYRIKSAGIHSKEKQKSIGIRFPSFNFVEEGNFSKDNQIFAFNYNNRPQFKLQKLYSSFLLRNVNFINKFVYNPAKNEIIFLENLLQSGIAHKIKGRPFLLRDFQIKNPSAINKSEAKMKHKQSQRIEEESIQILNNLEKSKLKQEKERLETYKKQILVNLSKRKRESISGRCIKQLTLTKTYSKQLFSTSAKSKSTYKKVLQVSNRQSDTEKDIPTSDFGNNLFETPQKVKDTTPRRIINIDDNKCPYNENEVYRNKSPSLKETHIQQINQKAPVRNPSTTTPMRRKKYQYLDD